MLDNLFQEIDELMEDERYAEAEDMAYSAIQDLKQILKSGVMYDIPLKPNAVSNEVLDELYYLKNRAILKAIGELERLETYAGACDYEQRTEGPAVSYNEQVRKQYYMGKI